MMLTLTSLLVETRAQRWKTAVETSVSDDDPSLGLATRGGPQPVPSGVRETK